MKKRIKKTEQIGVTIKPRIVNKKPIQTLSSKGIALFFAKQQIMNCTGMNMMITIGQNKMKRGM